MPRAQDAVQDPPAERVVVGTSKMIYEPVISRDF
jgi:hypothetical protein